MRAFFASLLVSAIFLLPQLAMGQSGQDREAERVRSSDASAPQMEAEDVKRVAKLIVEKTNDFREEQGLSPVKTNAELQDAARYFAQYMASNDEYGHHADGKRPADRADEHGYDYCIVLENIAYQYSSRGFEPPQLAGKFARGWEESPGHRENMLDPDVTETGVAVTQSEESGHFYAVQMFGRPESKQIEFEIRNDAKEEVTYKLAGKEFVLPPRYTRTHYRCRLSELVLQVDEDNEQSLTPKPGNRIVVTERDGVLRLER